MSNRRMNVLALVTALAVMLLVGAAQFALSGHGLSGRGVTVGVVYDGDESTPYSYNFVRSVHALESRFGDRVRIVEYSNTSAERSGQALQDLVDQGCDIIFTTSSQFQDSAREMAASHPDVTFCAASADNADPQLSNYHSFMGKIYEGRYASGVVAGMKLRELVDAGELTADECLVGFVASFPIPEVISGYTAFILGARSVMPEARLLVKYTQSWSSYGQELKSAQELIAQGCRIVGQHSDTIGPAVACEATAGSGHVVYSVGYNQPMLDVAPTTSLVSTRINWTPYFVGAVEALMQGQPIESHVRGNAHGNDLCAGFEQDWVQLVELNEIIAAKGSSEAVNQVVDDLAHDKIEVFRGPYTGVDPDDARDRIDLSEGYTENAERSAPSFHWILDEVVSVVE